MRQAITGRALGRMMHSVKMMWGSLAILVVVALSVPGPAQAGFPGHNGRLAATLANGRLATMGPAGGNVVPYSVHGNWPSWSADGTKLAFNETIGGGGIGVMDAYGRHLRSLGAGWDPAWSPSGTRIAFGTRNGIGVMNADGSNRHVLPNTSDTFEPDDNPAWSPDGKTIVFSKDHSQGYGQLWLVDADGGNPRHLTSGSGPAWAPDGHRIVFQANVDDGGAIGTIKPDGTGRTAVAQTCCQTGTAWSPDGTRIAYFMNEGGTKALWTADPTGAMPTRLDGGFLEYDTPLQRMDWQPLDGPWASPSTLDAAFPATPTGQSASRYIVLTNTGIARMQVSDVSLSGPDAPSFQISGDTCTGASLAPGNACHLTVKFGPDRVGGYAATLNFSDDAPLSPQTVALSGTGISPVALEPDPVTFGRTPIATESTPRTVTLRNNGSTGVAVSGVAVAGADAGVFAIGDDTCTGTNVGAGGSCTVTVRFLPDRTGARAARLEFSDDAPGSPQSVALSGTGVSPVALTPSSIAFAPQPDHSASGRRTVTLTNIAPADLTIDSMTVTGSDATSFLSGGDNCSGRTLAKGQSCTVQVRFRPLGTGAKTAALRFRDSAIDSPQTVALSGTGTPGAWLERSVQGLKFGRIRVGTTSPAQTVTLANVGSAPLTITRVTKEGTNPTDFRNLTQTCTARATLDPGQSCTASIAFQPTTTGPRAATLTITDTAPRNPHHVALNGTGT